MTPPRTGAVLPKLARAALAAAAALAVLASSAAAERVTTEDFSFHVPAGWHNELHHYSVPYGVEFYLSADRGGLGFEVQKISGSLTGELTRSTVTSLVRRENAAETGKLKATYRGASSFGGAASFYATVVVYAADRKETQEFIDRGQHVFVIDFSGSNRADVAYAKSLYGSSWRWK